MRVLLVACFALIAGCNAPPGEGGGDGDGGPDGGPELLSNDGPTTPEELCYALIDRVCGGGDCDGEPACIAADILLQYEPERCEAAFADEAGWPRCEPSPCERLVERVCGGDEEDPPCADEAGCEPAQRLLDRARGDDSDERTSALSSCAAALEDDVVFAPCVDAR